MQPAIGRSTRFVDDGRIVAATLEKQASVIDHLGKFYVLKISGPQWEGDVHSYLKRVKVRLPNGWLTIPDGKHRINLMRNAGYDENVPQNKVSTPGAKRSYEPGEEEELNNQEKENFQSGVGSQIT